MANVEDCIKQKDTKTNVKPNLKGGIGDTSNASNYGWSNMRPSTRQQRDSSTDTKLAGKYQKLPAKGRPKATTQMEDEMLKQMVMNNSLITAKEIQKVFMEQHGSTVSKRTIQRRMRMLKQFQGIRVCTQPRFQKIELPENIRRQRLAWALVHRSMTVDDWRRVFNLDEKNDNLELKMFNNETLLGPTNSPDLSIKNLLMEIIEPKLVGFTRETNEKCASALRSLWKTDPIMVDEIEMVYSSMPKKIELVIANNGNFEEMNIL